jgi:hypothetical protein
MSYTQRTFDWTIHRFDNVGCCNWCCVFPMALVGGALLPVACIVDVAVVCSNLVKPDPLKQPPSPPPMAIAIATPTPPSPTAATATAIVDPPKLMV